MTKPMEVTFKIRNKKAKRKIIKIRNTCNFTKLFVKWVKDYEVPKEKVLRE